MNTLIDSCQSFPVEDMFSTANTDGITPTNSTPLKLGRNLQHIPSTQSGVLSPLNVPTQISIPWLGRIDETDRISRSNKSQNVSNQKIILSDMREIVAHSRKLIAERRRDSILLTSRRNLETLTSSRIASVSEMSDIVPELNSTPARRLRSHGPARDLPFVQPSILEYHIKQLKKL